MSYIIRWLGGQNAYKNIQKYLFWKRSKVTLPQLSKKERVFVAEKYFERKSYIAVQAAFWQPFLIIHHFAKGESNKI